MKVLCWVIWEATVRLPLARLEPEQRPWWIGMWIGIWGGIIGSHWVPYGLLAHVLTVGCGCRLFGLLRQRWERLLADQAAAAAVELAAWEADRPERERRLAVAAAERQRREEFEAICAVLASMPKIGTDHDPD